MSSEPGFQKSTSPGIREEMGSYPETEGMTEEAKERFKETKGKLSRASARAKSRASETAGKVSEWSKEKWHRLSRKGEETQGIASERTERARFEMRSRINRIRSRMEQGRNRAAEIVDEYPLVVGLSALAIGLFVGLSLRASSRERRAIGPKASRWREQVREHAEHLIERGKEVAQHTAEAVKEEARRQGLTTQGIKESVKHVVQEAGSSAEREGLTPEGMGEKVEAVAERAGETLKEETRRQEDRPL